VALKGANRVLLLYFSIAAHQSKGELLDNKPSYPVKKGSASLLKVESTLHHSGSQAQLLHFCLGQKIKYQNSIHKTTIFTHKYTVVVSIHLVLL